MHSWQQNQRGDVEVPLRQVDFRRCEKSGEVRPDHSIDLTKQGLAAFGLCGTAGILHTAPSDVGVKYHSAPEGGIPLVIIGGEQTGFLPSRRDEAKETLLQGASMIRYRCELSLKHWYMSWY